jgi:hypothetical protein
MKRSQFTDEQIVAIVEEDEAGRKVADVCRANRITEQTTTGAALLLLLRPSAARSLASSSSSASVTRSPALSARPSGMLRSVRSLRLAAASRIAESAQNHDPSRLAGHSGDLIPCQRAAPTLSKATTCRFCSGPLP